MNNLNALCTIGAIAYAVIPTAYAQLNLTNVVVKQLAEQGTEIQIMFDGIPPQPMAYQLEQPARLVLDFDQAQLNVEQKHIVVASQEARSIDLSSAAQRARLVVHLAQAGDFSTRVEANSFVVKIKPWQNKAKTELMPMLKKNQQGLADISFQRGQQGDGQVIFKLLGPDTTFDIQQQGNQVVVKLLGHQIPKQLIRGLNVNDFATPVSTIDAENHGLNGVIRIQTSGDYEYIAYQNEDLLRLSFKRTEAQIATKATTAHQYSGKKISLDFQDIEVRRVLQLLADFTNINMVAADSVTGHISLHLQDVPWDQALDIILKAKNLEQRKNANIIMIAPMSEFAKSDAEQAKMLAEQIKLAPIQTEYIQLNYAKAADIEKLIKDNKSITPTETEGQHESLLSFRGSISIDQRTNTLIVSDTAAFIAKINKMVDLLDVAVKQVMVEARLVTADTSFSRELGVKWGLQHHSRVSNPVAVADQVQHGSPVFDLGVNLASKTAGNFSFGLLKISDYMLNLELSAMQADGSGEVLSAPKVLTGDKQKAYILRGDQIPYQAWSQNTGAKTEFKDANLKLEVTPSITPDGKVQMALKIEKDTIGQLTDAGYSLKTNKLETNVLVDDGETVVLGGIFDDAKTQTSTKIPFLGDLPIVGALFKNNKKVNMQSELLIFITPRIVNDTVSRNH